MMAGFFTGQLVRLTAREPKEVAQAISRWNRNSEFWRLLDTDPPLLSSTKQHQDRLQKELEEDEGNAIFMIRRLEDERLIGYTALWSPEWPHAESWFTIAIGEPDCWGKGYGQDASRLMLNYGFNELNLHRITLGVFGYNTRAVHVYEKLGFKHEGIGRDLIRRAGRYYDIHFMGILREEWEG